MHSMMMIIVVGFLLAVEATGIRIPFPIAAAGLAIGVLLMGLPHGGMDQQTGLRLLYRIRRPMAVMIFFSSYLLVAALVVAGWFVSPFLTLVAFFSLSAWHFGLEEEIRKNLWLVHRPGMIARGGMVIWIPAFFQGDSVTRLLTMIIPAGDLNLAGQIVGAIQYCFPVLLVLLIADTLFPARSSELSIGGLSEQLLHQLRVLAFALLFSIVDPLISFGVYFCLWHSIIGLAHLRTEFRLTSRELARKLVPISSLAIALFAAGFLFSSNFNVFAPAIVQTVFIGLSAVAVPHLLLHVVSDSLTLTTGGAAQ